MAAERVLLVEDNEDNLQLVRFLLERGGYTVLCGHNGREGLAMARQELPNLILMDLSLPEIDGWEAAQELKADPKTAHIPLLALTAHTLPGDRKRALELGFDGYISKPIDVAKFGDNISKAMQIKRRKSDQIQAGVHLHADFGVNKSDIHLPIENLNKANCIVRSVERPALRSHFLVYYVELRGSGIILKIGTIEIFHEF